MAEVMKYEDLHELGTDAAVKAAGKYMQKGKDYVVEDGDIIYFKVNTDEENSKWSYSTQCTKLMLYPIVQRHRPRQEEIDRSIFPSTFSPPAFFS